MQSVQANVFTRDDTFFGVCQALGDDFGFSPNWLRAALGVALIWNPLAAVAAYAAAGVVVAFSRLLAPDPRRAVAETAADERAVEPQASDNDAETELAAAA